MNIDRFTATVERVNHLPTIVEGKKDRLALELLGFTNIHTLDRPLYEVVERFDKGVTLQILTDFDKQGKKLYGQLFRNFCFRGVKIDNRLRHLLHKSQVSHIEGLVNYLEKNHPLLLIA